MQVEGSAAGKLVDGWLEVALAAGGARLEGWRLVFLGCWADAFGGCRLRHGCFVHKIENRQSTTSVCRIVRTFTYGYLGVHDTVMKPGSHPVIFFFFHFISISILLIAITSIEV